MNPYDENDPIRALLHETAADIVPQGSLEDIRRRLPEKAPSRRWLLPTLAAAAALVLVLGGVGWLMRGQGHTAPPPTTGTPEKVANTVIFYGGKTAHGYKLFAENHVLKPSNLLLDAVLEATQVSPKDPDYRTLWPAEVKVADVRFTGVSPTDGSDPNVIEVFLAGPAEQRPAGLSAKDAMLAIEAVVRTAQAAYGSPAPVEFLTATSEAPAQLTTVLGQNGPFAAGNDDDVMAPVQITSPANEATVKAGPVTVEGRAATFEANVVWEVTVGGDAVIANGHTTAAECCTLSPYRFTVNLSPGTYTIVVHDTDESGAGGPVNQDTKEIVVE